MANNLPDNLHSQKNCPKCAGSMTKGFVADYNYGESQNTVIQSVWVEGEFKSNWLGAKIKDNKKFLMTTFRCINCGFLESYATEEK
jgi:predicted nucleic-acid-binding Zn-ribbon protein